MACQHCILVDESGNTTVEIGDLAAEEVDHRLDRRVISSWSALCWYSFSAFRMSTNCLRRRRRSE
ncbi:hypothetical protein [Methylocella silvestris]|uniref:Uncharacterized protein n=1 Tax=Methylocella silvestris TaxID=199596 RepID=A0A2J7TBW7_METSI|nr:hypothetical protein [Methylocella silvestris]PNG24255.1 hypothetical protein CR492_19640 [Methylocella silvestris]